MFSVLFLKTIMQYIAAEQYTPQMPPFMHLAPFLRITIYNIQIAYPEVELYMQITVMMLTSDYVISQTTMHLRAELSFYMIPLS